MPAARTILHILSQRPEFTGSGVTVDALVREAGRRGWDQHVLCALPTDAPVPPVGGLPTDRIHAVRFGDGGHLPFPIPGMSDVMPYPSTVWSKMTREQLDRYRAVWRQTIRRVQAAVAPDLVHVNHLWLVAAAARDVCAGVRTVLHCHGTDLRQLQLCPHLAREVVDGNRGHDGYVALHDAQALVLGHMFAAAPERVHVVGAGFRDDIFHDGGAPPAEARAGNVLVAGKLAEAKGLPWLLDAVTLVQERHGPFTLHVAGDGHGPEADALRARLAALAPRARYHGNLDQTSLADLMRRCAVFVLPSLYEGLPLVLAEARACGCRLVATDLPGIRERLLPILGDDLALMTPPRVTDGDKPVAADLPAFTRSIAAALVTALGREPAAAAGDGLASFTWRAVFGRVEAVWEDVRRRPAVVADDPGVA